MSFYCLFCWRPVVTNDAFEWLLSIMNWINMYIQLISLSTAVDTKVTFEWLISFMNWFNMLFQVWSLWQQLFWKGWYKSSCCISSWRKYVSHTNVKFVTIDFLEKVAKGGKILETERKRNINTHVNLFHDRKINQF